MFDPNSATNPLVVLFVAVATLLFGVAPLCALLYFIYFVLTLPMRRRERARLFLYLLEIGLNEGRSPENAIADAAASDDYSLGKRFHKLAAHVKRGLSLGAAL